MSWLNDTLALLDGNTSVDHIVVLMHHCIASPVGGHPDPQLDAALVPLMRSHRVSLTLAGHAHFVSWAQESSVALSSFTGGELWYITNGAARGDDPYECSWDGESNLTIAVLENEQCQAEAINDVGAFLLHRVFDNHVEHVVIVANGSFSSSLNTSYRARGAPEPLPGSESPRQVTVGVIAACALVVIVAGLVFAGYKVSGARQRHAPRQTEEQDYIAFEGASSPNKLVITESKAKS